MSLIAGVVHRQDCSSAMKASAQIRVRSHVDERQRRVPVVCVHQHRTFHHHRYDLESRAREQRKAPGIVRIVGTAFDIDPFAVEVRRVIDENHRRSFRDVSVAEETNLRYAVPRIPLRPSDLLQVPGNPARDPVEGNYDDDGNALSRLDVRESLNGFREPARSRVRCVFRREVNHTDGVAR